MQKIKLLKPLKVNGKELNELPFDTSSFGAAELTRANKMAAEANNGVFIPGQEIDYNYHLAIAQVIIETSSKGEISVDDLKRIQGADYFTLQREGRNFLLESVTPEQETSDEPSDTTADSSKPAQ
jgi:hypothetical protein